MSRLVKGGRDLRLECAFAAAQVKRTSSQAGQGAAELAGPAAAADAAASSQQVAALEAELAQLRADAARAVETARTTGIAEGRRMAAEQRDRRETRLSQALKDMDGQWRKRLAELEPLALMIASEALDKMFGEARVGRDEIIAVISAQIARLGANSVVSVRVSGADFASADLVSAALAQDDACAISIDPTLSAGCAVLDLKLGQMEIDPATQWARLRSFLRERLPLDLAA